jgi:hypothetical protein
MSTLQTKFLFNPVLRILFSYPLLDRPVLIDAMYVLHNPHDATTGRLFYRLLSIAAVTGCHTNALAETVCTCCGRYRTSVDCV